jgi:hypothetical protein
MGNSQSNNSRNTRPHQSQGQANSPHLANNNSFQHLSFLKIDPNPSNPVHAKVVRRRHSSIGSTSHPTRTLRHQRSASSLIFSRLGLGCTSANVSVSSGESDSYASDLFDDDKHHVVHHSQYSDEPPTSPSTTTFSKSSQFTPPSSLPCSPPSHLAYYSPTTSDGHNVPGDSVAEAAFEAFLKHFPRKFHISVHLTSAGSVIEYRLTWILDTLRRTDYTRLSRTSSKRRETETYVDYMGGSLYPESLIRVHTEFLASNVLGNTHSISAR